MARAAGQGLDERRNRYENYATACRARETQSGGPFPYYGVRRSIRVAGL